MEPKPNKGHREWIRGEEYGYSPYSHYGRRTPCRHGPVEALDAAGAYSLSLAASGMEAIQKALALHPDVVLMDIRLQGNMDEVEAAQQIHASAAIPVIFMTAYVDADTQQRVGATSPWGCLYKPFSPPQVQSALEHVLSGHPPGTP